MDDPRDDFTDQCPVLIWCKLPDPHTISCQINKPDGPESFKSFLPFITNLYTENNIWWMVSFVFVHSCQYLYRGTVCPEVYYGLSAGLSGAAICSTTEQYRSAIWHKQNMLHSGGWNAQDNCTCERKCHEFEFLLFAETGEIADSRARLRVFYQVNYRKVGPSKSMVFVSIRYIFFEKAWTRFIFYTC